MRAAIGPSKAGPEPPRDRVRGLLGAHLLLLACVGPENSIDRPATLHGPTCAHIAAMSSHGTSQTRHHLGPKGLRAKPPRARPATAAVLRNHNGPTRPVTLGPMPQGLTSLAEPLVAPLHSQRKTGLSKSRSGPSKDRVWSPSLCFFSFSSNSIMSS